MSPHTMQTLAGVLGGMIDHPVARMAKKYWFLSVPIGLGLYGKLRARYEKNGKMHEYMADAADVLGPVLTLVAVFELAGRMEEQGKLGPTAAQMAAAKEVEYEIQQQQETPV